MAVKIVPVCREVILCSVGSWLTLVRNELKLTEIGTGNTSSTCSDLHVVDIYVKEIEFIT